MASKRRRVDKPLGNPLSISMSDSMSDSMSNSLSDPLRKKVDDENVVEVINCHTTVTIDLTQ